MVITLWLFTYILETAMKIKSQLLTIGCIALSAGLANAEPAKPMNNIKKPDEPLVLDTVIVC